METYKLSFGIINKIGKNIAEVIVNEGIEMDTVKVSEYHDFLLNNLEAPFLLLVNRKHCYTYTFEAQKIIARLEEIKSIAVVANTSGGVLSTKTLINVNGNANLNIELFREREEALVWLNKE
ncbi:hypothetical protein [Flavivirga algicola]|uniref:STAS/SEC14 domain-containing protein n=1 Tax=Flavivirga algicola TaxID=2729136 RepID=A0ABX1RWD1_9FLAO|nr:hypothetical protein [Flavivirga algicola]NMH87867.1 hypothetical protein [Flavivirga algicola]